ncbi:putative pantothenate transporter [Xylariaceae sp. FL0255]|nr:putative pantothenate transporter [Xylariaceae sp. FL0255]
MPSLTSSQHADVEEKSPATIEASIDGSSDTSFDVASERRLKWKLDLFILPLVSIVAFFAYVGRSDLSNAKIAGLSDELKLTARDYSDAATFFLIGYIIFQLPGTLLVKKIGPPKQFFGAMVIWGVLTTVQVCIHDFHALLIMRFFIGAAEAFVQGVVFYLSFWYTFDELATRGAIYFSTSTLAGAFNGLIAYAVELDLDGTRGWRAWRWLFLIEGVLPIAFSFIVLVFLPDSPETVRFGFSSTEKKRLVERARIANNSGVERLEMKKIPLVLLDLRFWLYALIAAGGHFCLESFSSFLPSLINDFGFDAVEAQAFTVIIYVVAFLGVIFWCRLADKTGQRGIVLIASTCFSILGYALLVGLTGRNGRFAATAIAAFSVYANIVIQLVWASSNFVGYTRRGSVLAFMNIFPTLFSISATQAYSDPPYYRTGNAVALGLSVLVVIATIVLRWYLVRLNNVKKSLASSSDSDMMSAEDIEEVGDRHPNFFYYL